MRSAGVGICAAVRSTATAILLNGVLAAAVILYAVPVRASLGRAAADLLAAYGLGQYDDVVSALSASTVPVAVFARDLHDAAVARLAGESAALAPRDRIVAAAVALEAARALPPHPNPSRMTESQWADRVRLLEWGCALLREDPSVPAGPAEHAWDLASVAFLEQASGAPFYAYQDVWTESARHLDHLRARTPGEPRWALADAVSAEQAAGAIGFPLDDLPNESLDTPLTTPRYDVRVQETPAGGVDLVFADPRATKKFPDDPLNFRVPLRNAVRAYARLLSAPGVGPEAQLHLGAIEVSLGQPDIAYPHLDAARAGAVDPVLVYAANFFRGAALTRLGQVRAAESSFRSALGAVPHAESATIALAWLLMLNQHRAEASALTAEELAASSVAGRAGLAVDPLTVYGLGDSRLWPIDIGELRRALSATATRPPR